MRSSRHQSPARALVAALVLLASFALIGTRPAAAAAPAARVHAYGVPALPDVVTAHRPIVGIAANPTGVGYWLVGADGGIFGLGGAPFLGSTGGTALHKPVVGMAATPTGAGYWLVASDGGIFAYGDARYMGSTGGIALHQPVVGMAASASGAGYWLVAADGGVFAYGDAPAAGSVPGAGVRVGNVVGIGRSAGGAGYVIAGGNGGVSAFGDAPFLGSPALPANRAVVGVATSGVGYWLADADAPPPPPPPPPPQVGPRLPNGSGDGRRIVYCVSCQRVWYVESSNIVVKSNLVSGRAGTPRPGTYSVYSKSRHASSGSVTMEYMVRFAFGRTLAIGFHAIPRTSRGTPIQSESQLGTYQSHGCVRQADRDALYTWNYAPIGTKVVVTA